MQAMDLRDLKNVLVRAKCSSQDNQENKSQKVDDEEDEV